MTARSFVFAFEGLADDLARPPMAALRALLSNGVVVSARGWQELPLEARESLARAGAEDRVDETAMAKLLGQVPMSQIKLIGRTADPSPDTVPAALVSALGPLRPLTLADWRGLRALDRYVLASLVKNARLLARALGEVFPQQPSSWKPTNAWTGAVARSEVHLAPGVLQQVLSPQFMDGSAFVLTTVAGRRAARRLPELFDRHAESTVGPVEIDWGFRQDENLVFWQAHASTWDGTFFPAAALLAASSAAVAFYDLVKSLDPTAALVSAGIREEPWDAGRNEPFEAPTALFSKPPLAALGPSSFRDTIRTDPPDVQPAAEPYAPVPRVVPTPVASSPVVAAPIRPRARAGAAPPSSRVVLMIALVGFINLVVLCAIIAFLVHSRH